MTEFKPGDVVMLKSGGVPMTVENIREDFIECTWHSVDGHYMDYAFKRQVLIPYPTKMMLRLYRDLGIV